MQSWDKNQIGWCQGDSLGVSSKTIYEDEIWGLAVVFNMVDAKLLEGNIWD